MTIRHCIITLILAAAAAFSLPAAEKSYKLQSPSGALSVDISAGQQACWSVSVQGTTVLSPSAISLTLDDGTVFGRGIGGQTTMQMLSRFRPDVIDLAPEYVVILAGINDIGRNNGYIDVEHTFGNLVSMVQLAQANGIKPIMCTICPAREIGWRKRVGDPRPQIARLNGLITAYASEHGIPVADYNSAMRTPDGAMDPRYETDAVHPNTEGYKVMERVLLETFESIDKQR